MAKRYCLRGHDTEYFGRYGSDGRCKQCNLESKRMQALDNSRPPEFMPDLQAYREKRGYTRAQIAWESSLPQTPPLSVDTIAKIEEQKQKASYRQRVAIFQAFNVLGARESEAREAEMEEIRRRVRAGVA